MADISTVGIVGSGIMGSGLVEVAARSGFNVIVRSRSKQGAESVVATVTGNLDKQVARGRLDQATRDAVLGRIEATDHLGRLADFGRDYAGAPRLRVG